MEDQLSLFASSGSGPGVGMTLYYNSQDPFVDALGLSWSHRYDYKLTELPNGNVQLRLPQGRTLLYTLSGSAYSSDPGDFATLTQNTGGSFTRTRPDGVREEYAPSGELLAITDRNANSVTLTYSAGRLQTVSDGAGHSIAFTYDGSGHLATLTDPAGQVYSFNVGEALNSVTLPGGATWLYSYTNGDLTAKRDPLNNLTTYVYDAQQRVVMSTDPEERVRSITYPTSTATVRTTTFTEKDGGVWLHTYDNDAGVLLSKTDPLGGVTSYTYDASGNVLTKTAPGNATTSYTYDSKGNLLSITDPVGQVTTMTYNTFGQVLTVSGVPGNQAFTYDAKGNLLTATDPNGHVTQFTYDAQGRLLTVTNPLNEVTTLAYDTANNLTALTPPNGVRTEFSDHTPMGLPQTVRVVGTGGGVMSTTMTYTSAHQPDTVSRIVDGVTRLTDFAYDALGQRTAVTDAEGHTTAYEYNAAGQVQQITDALNQVTEMIYSGSGCGSCGGGVDKLVGVIDANLHRSDFAYDLVGRRVRETDPLDHTLLYSYDSGGNLDKKYFDLNGDQVINSGDTLLMSYTWTADSRLASKTDHTLSPAATTSYTWEAGRLKTAVNPALGYTFEYYPAGQLKKVTDSLGQVVSYDEYDAADRRKKVTIQPGVSSDVHVLNYAYNSKGQLATLTSSRNGVFTFTYDQFGRRATLTYPNGIVATSSYHPQSGALTGIVYRNPDNSELYRIDYPLHDKVDNRKEQVENGVVTSYSYDATYQLTQSVTGASAENYLYDPVGNRTEGPQNDADAYLHDDANRMLVARYTPQTRSYDVYGNRATRYIDADSEWRYTWDGENQLIKAEQVDAGITTLTVEMSYDPLGRRIRKVKTVADGTISDSRYLYDNEDIAQRKLTVTNPDSTVTISRNRYTHGPGLDEPLAWTLGSTSYYLHADGLGSIVRITDASRVVKQSISYTPYGDPTLSVPAFESLYAYTGREYDKEIKLYYYRARYYDYVDGRFISKDPIGLAGGDVNLYRYVQNNPVNYVDPSGLEILVCNRKAGGSTGILGGNHAYLWSTKNNFGWGMQGMFGSGNHTTEGGPDIDSCNRVENSDNYEEAIIEFIIENSDNGIWFPLVNDCHNAAKDAVEASGLIYTGAPGGRIGNIPTCVGGVCNE